MKYVRFYEEFKNKRAGISAGTVVAVFYQLRSVSASNLAFDSLVAVFDRPNSPVASSSVGAGHLHDKCRRVSEAKARKIHPMLFVDLDREQF